MQITRRDLEKTHSDILMKHGFTVAAKEMDYRGMGNKAIARAVVSWDNFPKCMNVYPSQLTEKHYTDI